MNLKVHFATTADGFSIAYSAVGEGETLIQLPVSPIFSHMQREWQLPDWQPWYQRLAKHHRFVRYDGRGTGLSDREVTKVGLDEFLLDLDAVVQRAGEGRPVALFAAADAGPVAMAYAARHPDRVSKVILWCARSEWGVGAVPKQLQLIHQMLMHDFELFTENLAHFWLGWGAGEQAHRLARVMQDAISHETAMALVATLKPLDIAETMPRIQAPTLVMYRRDLPAFTLTHARNIAASIPNARLAVFEGNSLAPFIGDYEAIAAEIDSFLDVPVSQGPEFADEACESSIHTILFTDLEGSASLTQQLGDVAAHQVLREHGQLVRQALRAHGGSEVKTLGDGFMASFASPTRALDCAIAIQKATAAADDAEPEVGLKVRVGLNAGEPIADDADLFGTAVITAARIASQARGREILVSNVVRELVAGKGFLFADHGETVLRGFDEPVRVYELHWRETATAAA